MKQVFIISGLSGAGKSSALGFFEDTGFFCMDNIPPRILPDVISLIMQSGIDKAAMVVDARSEVFGDSIEKIRELKAIYENIIKIIFLEASETSIYERYALTRRTHPLGMNIEKAVKKEREILASIREEADVIVDTTNLSPRQLREKLRKVLEESYGEEFVFTYRLQSFGFKYGAPLDSDFIFDARFFPNPYYIPELSQKTGLNKEVKDYLSKFKNIASYIDNII
ncbi:MAG: RNase adaptor protein RapZ, partial [Thermotogaceae bacterium]|nr:RNase adaptor protein RapZ [Thermotogaceae bacterium]